MEKSVVVSLRLDTEPKYVLLNRKTVREVDPALATVRAARDQPLIPFFCASGYINIKLD